VCVDVTALLTLEHLGILDEITGVFAQVVIPEQLRSLLRFESAGYRPIHRLAERLLRWHAQHRSKIRVRHSRAASDDAQAAGPYTLRNGVWTPREQRFAEALGDGVGEAADLAEELGIPLYSDEIFVRHWSGLRGGVSFGTVALLRRLKQLGRLTQESETKLLAVLVGSNYRQIPYELYHLQSRLITLTTAAEAAPRLAELQQDEVLGAFLRDLRTTELPTAGVMTFVFRWMVAMVADEISEETRVELISHLLFVLLQRSEEGIISGIQVDRREQITARVGAGLLLTFATSAVSYLPQAWSLLKSVVERTNSASASAAEEILFSLMPEAVADMATKRGDETVAVAASVSSYFPAADRAKWDARIARRLLRS
jgi:hypothetical protein